MNLTAKIYNDEDAARAHLEAIRWPSECSCPLCGGTEKIASVKMISKPSKTNPEPREQKGWYHCGDCRRKFTVRTGTIYERSHIPLHKWVLATQLLCSSKKGMSAHQLHRMMGVTYKTAWFVFHRIREAMLELNPPPMGDDNTPVQADETYFGKKDVVIKRTIRGKPTHGSKMSVFGLVSGGKARNFHVDRADSETVKDIIMKNIRREAELHTDESPLYKRVGKEFVHKTVRHTMHEWVKDGAHTNGIENYFSVFKRGMRGVYQHCSERHLQRYLTEFDFRYNSRDLTDFERSDLAHKGAEGKRLTYRRINHKKAA